jgi:hypothetical protein
MARSKQDKYKQLIKAVFTSPNGIELLEEMKKAYIYTSTYSLDPTEMAFKGGR